MKVKKIRIQNILGIEDLTIEPGALTIVSGRNATGKTSVLAALKDLAEGGHDPTLLRSGSSQGSVEMLLDDGVEVFKVIRPAKSVTTVVDPKLGKISKPAAWIKDTLDALSLDPVQFLTLKPRLRMDMLLAALPLDFEMAAIGAIGVPAEFVAGLNVKQHPLCILDDLKGSMFGKRRELNTMAREKRATASQMRNTLPQNPEGEAQDWKAELDRLIEERSKLEAQASDEIASLKATGTIASLEREAKEKIDALQNTFNQQVGEIVHHCQEACDYERKLESERVEAVREALRPAIAAVSEKIGEAGEKMEIEAKADQVRATISSFEGDATTVEKNANVLTRCLDGIQELKESLLKNLPIKDLELVEGDFHVAGIPFDRLNDAEKHRIAIEVAKLKAGELGLILMDRTEIFDDQSWDAFVKTAVESGLQVIAGKVSNEDALTVEAVG